MYHSCIVLKQLSKKLFVNCIKCNDTNLSYIYCHETTSCVVFVDLSVDVGDNKSILETIHLTFIYDNISDSKQKTARSPRSPKSPRDPKVRLSLGWGGAGGGHSHNVHVTLIVTIDLSKFVLSSLQRK